MKKIYYLSTCSTCTRIINELDIDDSWDMIDIKKEGISREGLEKMHELSGSYEALFSKRSRQYRAMGLQDQPLEEDDYKQLIQKEYTFLKRPVILYKDSIFIGNSKKVIEHAKQIIR